MCRLYWITKQAGERQGSGLMKANAWHHRADAISSVVALIGVGKDFWIFERSVGLFIWNTVLLL
jgi:divalent metal cation (Fe/Co/Zn/Cd) transporter